MLYLFATFSLLVLLPALLILFSRNVLYSAFALLLSLLGVAGIFVLNTADFLAVTQLVIYVGGVLVVLLFGIMFTGRAKGGAVNSGTRSVLTGTILAALFFALLLSVLLQVDFATLPALQQTAQPGNQARSTVQQTGTELMTGHLLPFELAAFLLLLALVGAAFIAGTPDKGQPGD